MLTWALVLGGDVVALLVGMGLIVAVAGVIIYGVSRSLRTLSHAAERFAKGDLRQRLPVTGPLQIAALAEALNRMAGQLDQRLRTVAQQRNELDAILSSMVEGVLAIDTDERVISLNAAAARLLGLDAAKTLGRSIQEAVRNTALQQFVAQALKVASPMQTELSVRAQPEDKSTTSASGGRQLQVQAAVLHDAGGERLGAVLVLHDVSQVRRLENVRRDFVANVSHEIKTPVTAIKAAVETVLDDATLPAEERSRFLGIVARQADRLQAIIEDLLSLARIEQDREQQRIELSPRRIADVLTAVAETCQPQAQAKHIRFEIACPEDLGAPLNGPLMEQAAINLVDNAVKYSPENSVVRLRGQRRDGEVVISVQDQGPGIEAEHLPRLFERFYRTDKARSRALGGTGLGLAIVKHIVQVHGGHVSVDSTPGQGSTFDIHLPGGG